MNTALLGHTGFVGTNLLSQAPFAHAFASKTAPQARGARFDLLVCAAAPGFKWKANRDPVADKAAVDAMQSARAPHSFLGIDNDGGTCVVSTTGNPWGVLMLRGGRGGGDRGAARHVPGGVPVHAA